MSNNFIQMALTERQLAEIVGDYLAKAGLIEKKIEVIINEVNKRGAERIDDTDE